MSLVKRGKTWHTHFFVDGHGSGSRSILATGGRRRPKEGAHRGSVAR